MMIFNSTVDKLNRIIGKMMTQATASNQTFAIVAKGK